MESPLNEGAPLPERAQIRWYKPIGPTRGRPLRAVILGESFLATWTHFDNTTLPCTNTPECYRCRGGLAPRYSGYTASLAGRLNEKRMLCLTYFACCQFTDIIKRRGTLRGLDVTLARAWDSTRAPVKVTVEREIPAAQLPAAFDVVDSLAKMWGVNQDYVARGCRKLGADETAQKYIQAEQERKGTPGAVRVFKPEECG